MYVCVREREVCGCVCVFEGFLCKSDKEREGERLKHTDRQADLSNLANRFLNILVSL